MVRTSYIRCDYDDVRFVVNQHTEQCKLIETTVHGRHVVPRDNTFLLLLLKAACVAEKQEIPIV